MVTFVRFRNKPLSMIKHFCIIENILFPNRIKHYIQIAKLDLAYCVCVYVINDFFPVVFRCLFAQNYHYSNINRVNNRFQVLGIRCLLIYVLIGNQDLRQAKLFIGL